MNYILKNNRPSGRSTRRSTVVVFTIAIILFLFLIIAPRTLSSFFTLIISPLWNVEKATMTENDALKQRLAALESSETQLAALNQENNELKELLGKTVVPNSVLAGVVRKPPASAYDTLIIDAGENESLGVGDRVYALGDIVIGKVVEVHSYSSKVQLFSTPGEKFDVMIGKNAIETTATARGGGVFEVVLPRDSSIEVGDVVSIPSIAGGDSHSTFSTVTSVVAEPARAFSTVLFKSPVDMGSLRWVTVEHSANDAF